MTVVETEIEQMMTKGMIVVQQLRFSVEATPVGAQKTLRRSTFTRTLVMQTNYESQLLTSFESIKRNFGQ